MHCVPQDWLLDDDVDVWPEGQASEQSCTSVPSAQPRPARRQLRPTIPVSLHVRPEIRSDLSLSELLLLLPQVPHSAQEDTARSILLQLTMRGPAPVHWHVKDGTPVQVPAPWLRSSCSILLSPDAMLVW